MVAVARQAPWGLAALVLSLGGAACRAPTEATLEISTDIPCALLTGTSISTYHGDEQAPAPLTATTACDPSTGTIGSLVLTPGPTMSGIVVEVVTGAQIDPGSCHEGLAGCTYERRLLNYIPHTNLVIPILQPKVCEGQVCAPDQTCVSSEDGGPSCQSYVLGCDATGNCQLPASTPTPPDGGVDAEAGPHDASKDSTVAPPDASDANPVDAADATLLDTGPWEADGNVVVGNVPLPTGTVEGDQGVLVLSNGYTILPVSNASGTATTIELCTTEPPLGPCPSPTPVFVEQPGAPIHLSNLTCDSAYSHCYYTQGGSLFSTALTGTATQNTLYTNQDNPEFTQTALMLPSGTGAGSLCFLGLVAVDGGFDDNEINCFSAAQLAAANASGAEIVGAPTTHLMVVTNEEGNTFSLLSDTFATDGSFFYSVGISENGAGPQVYRVPVDGPDQTTLSPFTSVFASTATPPENLQLGAGHYVAVLVGGGINVWDTSTGSLFDVIDPVGNDVQIVDYTLHRSSLIALQSDGSLLVFPGLQLGGGQLIPRPEDGGVLVASKLAGVVDGTGALSGKIILYMQAWAGPSTFDGPALEYVILPQVP